MQMVNAMKKSLYDEVHDCIFLPQQCNLYKMAAIQNQNFYYMDLVSGQLNLEQ